jgi:hypothetical protein
MTPSGRLKSFALKAIEHYSVERLSASWRALEGAQPGSGRGCLVIGNAPSVAASDSPFNGNYDIIAVNGGLTQPVLGLPPRFWVATDRRFLRRVSVGAVEAAKDASVLPILPVSALLENGVRFFRAARFAAAFPGVRLNPGEENEASVVGLARDRVPPILKTVTATAVCLAGLLGYRRIALVGCDAYGLLITGKDRRLHHFSAAPAAGSHFDYVRLSLAHRLSYHFAARYCRELGTEVVNYSRTTAVEEIPRGEGLWGG